MLARLIDEAMERAVYEIIADEGTCWGEIPGLQGVWGPSRHPGGLPAGAARGLERLDRPSPAARVARRCGMMLSPCVLM